MDSPNAQSAPHGGAIDRFERAVTLLLATSALAAVALIGWGGFVLDLGPIGAILVTLVRESASGHMVEPGVGDAIARVRWEDLGPLAGTVVTLLFCWHAISLAAESVLLLASSCGWLWNTSLRPLWAILDVLNSAPLAAPKRLIVATALASQMLVRSAGPSLAASPPSKLSVAVVVDQVAQDPSGPSRPSEDTPSMAEPAPPGIVHSVRPGDTFSGMSLRYYGHACYWPVLFNANRGAIMAQPAFGVGTPIRLTSPDYLLPGWDALVPPLPGHLELGDQGELVYVVQRGDTLSGIAQRFGVSLDDLIAANTGAETADGRVFENPDVIWPGLPLQVRSAEPASAPAEESPPEAEVAPAPAPEEPPAPIVPSPSPTPAPQVVIVQTDRTSVPMTQVVPTAVPTAETPARPRVDEPSLINWPEALGVGALGIAALVALRARRSRRPAGEPENDTPIDVDAFTLAAPGAVVAARRGDGDDPHGVVLGERVSGALLRHIRAAGIDTARTVSVRVGRTGCAVTLEAPLEQRQRLEATLRTASHLARRLKVSRSADQDVVVELEGIQRGVLDRVRLEECPLLLCIGLQPDTRAYLAGWDALGHLLAATQAGTNDAHEHLASLVATLAGQSPPADLQLYTLASKGSLLDQLGPLPHQRAVVDATDRVEATQLLATVRAELERRQRQALDSQVAELVLVISELAQVAGEDDLVYLLRYGSQFRMRVIAATSDTALERTSLMDVFESHLVFALNDEEASARLLGKPWALTLAEPGRLLARLGQRHEVEILGLHLTEDGRRDLLASMAVVEPSTASPIPVTSDDNVVDEPDHVDVMESHGEVGPLSPGEGAAEAYRVDEAVRQNGVSPAPDEQPVDGADAAIPSPASSPTEHTNGHVHSEPVLTPEPLSSELPQRIARLLERHRLVIDCENAVMWSRTGQVQLSQSSPIEVLFRVAAAPLLQQGPLDGWPGVKIDEVLEEVWAPRARVRNRESGQTWLGKNLERLQDEVRRVGGSLDEALLVRSDGLLRVNADVAVSDVEAFMEAVQRARAGRGPERIAAAEEALVLRVPELLPGAYVARTVIGKKIELYRWLAEEHWERASGRLEAFGREMMGLLARAYRDAGRNEDALLMYAQLFAEDPLDRGAHEGLLLAAAGTGDVAQLHEAWQQICVCLGGEGDLEIRGLYERLLRELERAPNPERTGSPVGVGGGSLRQISSPVVRVTADEGLLSAPPPMTQPSGGLDAR
jgi:hypothetical protein